MWEAFMGQNWKGLISFTLFSFHFRTLLHGPIKKKADLEYVVLIYAQGKGEIFW